MLSFAARAAKEIAAAPGPGPDAALIGAGIAAMLGFAAILEVGRRAAMAPPRAG